MTNYDYYVSNKQINIDAADCMRGSWKDAAKTTALYMVLCVIYIAIPVLVGIFVKWWLAIPISLISMMFVAIFSYGFSAFCHKLALQENPKINLLFAGFSKKMGRIIRVSIKKFFLGLFWLILLVVPFVVKSIGYSMATFLMIDKDVDSENALKESQHIMKQNYGRYLKFLLCNTHWFLLILISAGIGFVWIAPLIMTKKALFYENLKTDFICSIFFIHSC